MKKLHFLVLFLSFLAVFLTGCKEEPTAIEKAQQRAVEIGEQYLAYEITADEADEMLDSILVPETEGNGSLYLSTDIDYLSFIIGKHGATYKDVQEKVDFMKDRDYND